MVHHGDGAEWTRDGALAEPNASVHTVRWTGKGYIGRRTVAITHIVIFFIMASQASGALNYSNRSLDGAHFFSRDSGHSLCNRFFPRKTQAWRDSRIVDHLGLTFLKTVSTPCTVSETRPIKTTICK